ncbi:hypothetical protein QYF36_006634 [Acer negundo]|nr:hypothetical protein QYF36_006634 [Acer negundo]
MCGGRNEDLCINGRGGVELLVLAYASAGVIRSSKDSIKKVMDGKNLVRNDGSKVKVLAASLSNSVVCLCVLLCMVFILLCPKEVNCLADQLARKGFRNGGLCSVLLV